MEEKEKEQLSSINFMTFPRTVTLQKSLYKKEVMDIKAGPSNGLLSGLDISEEYGLRKAILKESALQSSKNCRFVEVGSEPASVLEFKKLQMGEEQGSLVHRCLEKPQSPDCLSTLEVREHENFRNVDRCSLKRRNVGYM
ncbi:hypothetical protein IFM89_024139 [Coptis chinensis]|uniref:Uncharacterized protein n=1 Tax=Coptis chinensis TaxID=261450 RepID=A0A835I165_9MAGN|nr:hypothetical protein IFM89_024139 [Coptis chinensis]